RGRERAPTKGHTSAASKARRTDRARHGAPQALLFFCRRNRTRHKAFVFIRRRSRCIHRDEGGKATMIVSFTKKTVCACIVAVAGAAAVLAQPDALNEHIGRFRTALERGDYAA